MGEEITYALRFSFEASNNELEYETLITGFQLAIKIGCEHIHTSIALMVVANQKNGLYEIRGRNLAQYADKVKALTNHFKSFMLEHMPRSRNKREYVLNKLASSTFPNLAKSMLVEIVQVKAIEAKLVMLIIAYTND